ncbi:FAD:protein FMN transferase [Shimia marina]|uniref:FAD:protein FMN transferase n=1 Tax=Shimia marina TaxID=321267 RepID=A0A0P1EQ80_9RHOB|nr:FAD:protein FMN transferase [Shimia marina]CUH52026.1 Thiamine biosynthesis lipoprotein ApbE precursor [Shimia marina]SFE61782.1 thiamine biosynthesis lipoprotein [Shimia marina]
MTRINRRRFLTIAAASAALPAGVALAATETATWSGVALGAPAQMKIVGMTDAQAAPIFAQVSAELDRLEGIFSLYRDSELTRLNRNGVLSTPSAEMLDVLELSAALNRASGGAFDASVQPLWLAKGGQGDVDAAKALVGWDAVSFDAEAVRFETPGMALTLNGVAQGYVTDRVVAILRDAGLTDVLMDMGEVAALGHRADGAAWVAGVSTPAGEIVERVQLSDRALATSAPMATVLAGADAHIFGPDGAEGGVALASVSAPSAAVADGLSTALCLMDAKAGAAMVAQFDGAKIEALS